MCSLQGCRPVVRGRSVVFRQRNRRLRQGAPNPQLAGLRRGGTWRGRNLRWPFKRGTEVGGRGPGPRYIKRPERRGLSNLPFSASGAVERPAPVSPSLLSSLPLPVSVLFARPPLRDHGRRTRCDRRAYPSRQVSGTGAGAGRGLRWVRLSGQGRGRRRPSLPSFSLSGFSLGRPPSCRRRGGFSILPARSPERPVRGGGCGARARARAFPQSLGHSAPGVLAPKERSRHEERGCPGGGGAPQRLRGPVLPRGRGFLAS